MSKRILHPRIDGGPPRIKRKPAFTAEQMRIIREMADESARAKVSQLKLVRYVEKRGGCG